MSKWRQAILWVAVATAPLAAAVTISPGANLNATIEAAANGDTILLNPGVYTAPNTAPTPGAFAVGRRVTIRGLGATPAQVILRGAPPFTGDFGLYFLPYIGGASPNGATLENLTIDTSPGGIRIHDYLGNTRLTDITVRNVVISPNVGAAAASGFGVLLYENDRVVLDNVTITSYQAGIQLLRTTDSLVMNSTVNSSTGPSAPGLAVLGGSGNRFVGNTIGTPKASPTVDSGYSFTGGGVVFYNTKTNRFENNVLQGFRDDGLDFTALDYGGQLPLTNSTDNYVGKNTVVSTGVAAGLGVGTAIWSNCGSNNTWLYGNDASGSPEGGVTVWSSNSNMVLGNNSHGNGTVGVFISGGNETLGDCTVSGGAFQVKPSSNFVRSNGAYANRAEQIIIRSADTTDISLNFTSPRNGRLGALMPAADPANGQSAITFQTDARFVTSNGFRMVGNISSENMRGFWDDSGKDSGIEIFLNRIFSSTFSRILTNSSLLIDAGPVIGGNYWTQHATTGNPSNGSTPYSGVYQNLSNNTGLIVDRYPYQTQDLGRANRVQVFEPRAGWLVAQGTKRTVRWYAPGCIYVDLSLDGATSLAADAPNTGYAVVTIPGAATIGAHTITVSCKDLAGTIKGQGSSPGFSVTDGSLQLIAPGRDDVFNANTDIFVAWKKTAAIATVDVQLSLDGGATFAAATLSPPGGAANGLTGTFARIRLPNVASAAYAVIRVISGATFRDTVDGVFALRGPTGAFTNVTAGRKFAMGSMERLEWSSPTSSRLVTITANGTPIATKLPDRGYFDWIPKDLGTTATTLSATFFDTAGTVTLGTATNSLGSTVYTTTITFGSVSTIAPGASQTITATTNSGLPATLTSLTTSVCTISGNTATAVANGTCTIAANQAGNASFAPSPQVTVSFTVASGASSPRLFGIATRSSVLTGDNVMIAGFIVGGSVPKTVIVRGVGPSLAAQGVPGPLADPTLTLVPASGPTVTNDDWGTAANAAAVTASGFAPTNAKESAILATLNPGAYTAIVSGVGGGTGVGLVEVYELDHPEIPLTGIATRALVQTGSNVMIGGFIIQGSSPQTVIIRARGPSLTAAGVAGALQNPTLTLVPASGPNVTNDDWGTAANAAAVTASGFAPTDSRESAILITLDPGAYTAIVSGVGGATGVAIVEVYAQ
jgi:hypothetical protein